LRAIGSLGRSKDAIKPLTTTNNLGHAIPCMLHHGLCGRCSGIQPELSNATEFFGSHFGCDTFQCRASRRFTWQNGLTLRFDASRIDNRGSMALKPLHTDQYNATGIPISAADR